MTRGDRVTTGRGFDSDDPDWMAALNHELFEHGESDDDEIEGEG